MKGSPLRRALAAFFLILALVGYPLWRMTRAEETASAATAPAALAAAVREVHLQLAATTPPSSLKVLHLGKVVWEEPEPSAQMEKTLPLPYPDEGIDLRFQIAWPAGAPLVAVRVQLTDPAGEDHEKSIWSEGAADEVLTFP